MGNTVGVLGDPEAAENSDRPVEEEDTDKDANSPQRSKTERSTMSERSKSPEVELKTVSVDDVLQCLEFVGLKKYQDVFKEFEVEGEAVLDLDRDMLVHDLHITEEKDVHLIVELVRLLKHHPTLHQLDTFFREHQAGVELKLRQDKKEAKQNEGQNEEKEQQGEDATNRKGQDNGGKAPEEGKSASTSHQKTIIEAEMSDKVGALPSEQSQRPESKSKGASSTSSSSSLAPLETLAGEGRKVTLTGNPLRSPKAISRLGRANSLCAFTNADPEYWGPDRRVLRAKKKKSRQVRVFLSSTFRDFARERDHLFKNVFPRMEQECAGRGLQFIPIDLRWGVTAEESGRGDVIKLCLQEIDECTPFFVCMLGERYGWHQQTRNGDALLQKTFDVGAEIYPWCKEYETVSATEMEIRHAYLNDPDSMPYPYFYFRNPRFPEIHNLSAEDSKCYFAGSEYAKTMQGRLKEEIRARAKFPLPPEYNTVEELGKQMEADLWRAIDQEFPKTDLEDPLAEMRFYQETYAESRLRVYIKRPSIVAAINEQVSAFLSTGGGLVLTGPAGAGKTAALAHWKRKHFDVHGHLEDFVYIEHYLGAAPEATHLNGMLSRLFLEIQEQCGLQESMPLPDKAPMVKELFPDLCDAAANIMSEKGKTMVVLIGGLHRMIGGDDVVWLSPRVKPGLVFVVSVTEDSHMHQRLDQRIGTMQKQWGKVSLPELDQEQRMRLIKKYLIQFGKKLSTEQEAMIVEKAITGNPMFLVNFLEEIRVYGSYEGLTDYARGYLDAESIEDLFHRVLGRVETAYESFPVAKAFSYLASSRSGLNEEELLSLLGVRRAGDYTSFKHAVATFIQPIKGCLQFLHGYALRAARKRYLSSKDTQVALHSEIATFFQGQWMKVQNAKRHVHKFKIANELMYQLEQAQRLPELAEMLSDIEVFATLEPVTLTRFEMMRCWGLLGECGHAATDYFLKQLRAMFSVFNKQMSFANANHILSAAEAEAQRMIVLKSLANFFNSMGLYSTGATILLSVLNRQKQKDPSLNKSETHGHDVRTLGQMYLTAGKHDEAEKCLTEAKDILSRTDPEGNAEHIIRIQIGLTNIYKKRREFPKAKALIESAIRSCRDRVQVSESKDRRNMNSKELMQLHRDQELLADNLNDLGMLLSSMGDATASLKAYEESLELTQLMHGPDHIDVARTLQNVAVVLIAVKDVGGAEKRYTKAIRILQTVLGDRHPETATVKMNLAVLYGRMKRTQQALGLATAAVDVHTSVFGELHAKMEGNYLNLGKIMLAHGMSQKHQPTVEGGIKMLLKSANVVKRLKGESHPSLARLFASIGKTNFKLKRREAALKFYLKAQSVITKHAGNPSLAGVAKECEQVIGLLSKMSGAQGK